MVEVVCYLWVIVVEVNEGINWGFGCALRFYRIHIEKEEGKT